MPPPRRNHVNPTHAAFRSSVILGLGAEYGNQATWSHSAGMPFVANLSALAASPAFDACDPAVILLNTSTKTALEKADGNWAATMAGAAGSIPASVAGLTAAFNTHIWPSRSMASSRTKNWSNWAVVVTWAIAWHIVDSILPMPTDILKAFTWELLCMGTSRSVIIAIWSSIQNRHKVAGLKPPIIGAGEFSAWTRCLASLVGRPTALLFPVHRLIIAALLGSRPCLLRDQRDRLMVCDI